jgi:superfamily I DNA/RNA helicase
MMDTLIEVKSPLKSPDLERPGAAGAISAELEDERRPLYVGMTRATGAYVIRARVTALLNSRNHSTELATAAQDSQSPRLSEVVENACCRNGA